MKILSDEDGDTIWSDPLDIPRYIAGKTREHLEQCREEATQVETLASKIREEKEHPMNTNIDKRLQEIILDLFGDSPEADDKEIIDFYVSAIHAAFKDAGYIHLPDVKAGDYITINAGTVILNGDGTMTKVVRMTGAEWYQRFDEAWSNIYLEKHDALSATEWIEAAKIASGVSKSDET